MPDSITTNNPSLYFQWRRIRLTSTLVSGTWSEHAVKNPGDISTEW